MRMERVATSEDLDAIAALTRAGRQRLAEWSPRWWRPAPDADEVHRLWLDHLIASDDAVVRVATDHAHVVGCAVSVRQARQWFVDDVALADDDAWADTGVELLDAIAERPALTCVPTHHLSRRAASEAGRLHHVSSYWIRTTMPVTHPVTPSLHPSTVIPPPPPHTFGGALDAHAAGALAFAADEGSDGLLVGSPSLPAPPVYDPGGTVCVVDRVVGDPAPLLERALQASGARGDVLLSVVADVGDDRLRSGLRELEFERTVDVFAFPAASHRRRR